MSDRMRRVNEALREVLSEAIGGLKDPRIGFVTHHGREGEPRPSSGDRLRERPRLRAQAPGLARGPRSCTACSKRRQPRAPSWTPS